MSIKKKKAQSGRTWEGKTEKRGEKWREERRLR